MSTSDEQHGTPDSHQPSELADSALEFVHSEGEPAGLHDVSHVEDHTWPLLRACRVGGIAIALLGVVSLALWGWLRHLPGMWGVIIGLGIAAGFMLITVVVVLATSHSSPTLTLAVVMGSWLAKIAVVLMILLIIDDLQFYDRVALAVTMILSLIVLLAVETWSVLKAQTVYV